MKFYSDIHQPNRIKAEGVGTVAVCSESGAGDLVQLLVAAGNAALEINLANPIAAAETMPEIYRLRKAGSFSAGWIDTTALTWSSYFEPCPSDRAAPQSAPHGSDSTELEINNMGVFQIEGVWRYRFMLKGMRYFKALPECKNKTQAKAAEDARKTKIREGRDDGPEAGTNFRSFVKDDFLPWVEAELSPGTYQSYKWRSEALIAAFGRLDLAEVSQVAIERFKRQQQQRVTRRGEKQSPASVNRYLQILASIFTRAQELGMIKRDERPKIECARETGARIRYLSIEEEKALLRAADAWPYLRDLIVIGLATGLRRKELFSLQEKCVDLALSLINVYGKGGKLRRIPLAPSGETRAILLRRIRESKSEWLFTSPHSGGKLTRVDKSLAKACELAKIAPAITLHTLRHTFCTRLAAAGVDIRTISELAGHEDIETTMRYTHLVESRAHEAIQKLAEFREDYHKITTAEVLKFEAKAR